MAWWERPGVGVSLFGALCLVLAATAYLVFEEPLDATLAFGLGIVGLFALLVLRTRSTPSESAEAVLVGSSRALTDAAQGLTLEGRASTVPARGDLRRDRLFLAAAQSTKPLPVLDDTTVLYAGPATVRLGLAIEPPGRALADRWEAATGRRFADTPVAALGSSLAGMGLSEGLWKELRLREERGRYHISFRAADVRPPCMDEGSTQARIPCERTACALCSLACVALARALGRPVTLAEAEVARGRVSLAIDPEDTA